MPMQKLSLKERRMNSDARILLSAIRCFGQKGYTHASIGDIAKGAGVTAGLVSQRYGSKENLFLEACRTVIERSFEDVPVDTSPRECLLTHLRQIQKLSEQDPDGFEFCIMLHTNTDVPSECMEECLSILKASNAKNILQDAQKNGILPEGDLDLLMNAFRANAFHHIRLCEKYHLPIPDDDYYLQPIGFKDMITEERHKWHGAVSAAISDFFDTLIYFNIDRNTGEILRSPRTLTSIGNTEDARGMIASVIPKKFLPADQDRMQAFLDLDTYRDRLGESKYLTCECIDRNGKNECHALIPVERDAEGKVLSIVALVRTVG